jgi:type IV pilus assembly protein PilV
MEPVNNPPLQPRSPRLGGTQRGVGLIEILVATAVLSIGILGIIVLQVKTLADNASSFTRTQASIAAYSMFDLMRADRANALAGAYNTTVTAGSCPTQSSTLAQAQLRNWCLGFDANSPPSGYSATNPPPGTLLGGLAALGNGATGAIACNPTGPAVTASNCSITLTFNDSKATAGQAAQTLTFWTQL